MAKHVIHISDKEAANDFSSLLDRVRKGAEIVIEHDARPVAVVRPAEPHVRLLSESLRLAREHGSTRPHGTDPRLQRHQTAKRIHSRLWLELPNAAGKTSNGSLRKKRCLGSSIRLKGGWYKS